MEGACVRLDLEHDPHLALRLLHLIGAVLAITYASLFVAPFFLPSTVIEALPAPPRGELFNVLLDRGGSTIVALYSLAIVAMGVLALLAWAISQRLPQSRATTLTIFAWPIVSGVVLLFAQPSMTTDLYDYAFRGRQLMLHGVNPLVARPIDLTSDPFVRLLAWPNLPTPYGPLWLAIEAVVHQATAGAFVPMLALLKLVGLCGLLASAIIIWQALSCRPALRAVGVVLFAWNPLIMLESVANAHNDIVMTALALMALALIQRRRWTLALPCLSVALLVKVAVVLIVPLVGIVALSQLRQRQVTARSLVVGASMAVGLVLLIYGWFWSGPTTLLHLASTAQSYQLINSPTYVMMWVGRRSGQIDPALAVPSLRLAGSLVFLVAYTLVAGRLWRGPATLVTATFDATFLFLLLGAGWFWPWYVTWLLAPAALLVDRRRQFAAALFACTALLLYPALHWQLPIAPYFSYSLALTLTFGLPALAFAYALWRNRQASHVAPLPKA
jgi:hypothetical protein